MQPYWNQDRVDEFVRNVAGGFQPPSPLELAAQLLGLIGVILVFVLLYRQLHLRNRRRREQYSANRFIELAQGLRLSHSDRDLVRRLAEYLDYPREELHTLLRDRTIFEKAAARLVATEWNEADDLARPLTALAVRLGWKERDSGHIVRSTGDLPPGTELYDSEGRPLFQILEVHPAHLDALILQDLPAHWRKRRELELNFRRREGFYTMRTTIIATESAAGLAGTRAVLSHHPGRVVRRQNRAYFRRDIRLPARLDSQPAHTLNLSGGGVLLELAGPPAAGLEHQPGDRVNVRIDLKPRDFIRCAARVIAVRADGRILHLQFVDLQEAGRERLIHMLFDEDRRDARLSHSAPLWPLVCSLPGAALALALAWPASLVAETPPAVPDPGSAPRIGIPLVLGDYYYDRGQYELARIEYEREMLGLEHTHRSALAPRAKLGLSLMRLDRYHESLTYLNDRKDYSHLYLRMFAAFRSGWTFQALEDQGRILENADFSAAQKDRTRLLGGAVYLESGDYDRVRAYYSNLQRETGEEEVRVLSGRLLTSLDRYESLDRKNAYLAASFSAILPGAGQVYAGHSVDGVTAFLFNGMFLGSAIIMYDLETRAGGGHLGSGIFGAIGLVFYLANVTGAYHTAHRYNNYRERQFQQEVRDAFFHLDYIQKTSGVVFETDF
jgi:TM2 domain-containing membrane protein YozV